LSSVQQLLTNSLRICALLIASLTFVATAAPVEQRWLNEFPAYPRAVEWCSGCTMGTPGSGSITWTNFTTADPVEKVRSFYKKFYSASDNIFRVEKGGKVRKALSAVSAGPGSYPRCAQKLSTEVQTVITVSVFSPSPVSETPPTHK